MYVLFGDLIANLKRLQPLNLELCPQVRRVGENHGGAVHIVFLRSAVLRA